jgi:hypothetical protein
MARKKNESAPEIHGDQPPPVEVVSKVEAEDAAAREHSDLIVAQFGDGQPYERTRVVTEAKFFMAQSAEAMLEAGKRLILIKEHEPHGEFVEIVENQLGIHERAARRMMSAAVKYLSPKLESKRTTLSVLGKSKLFELVSEDDEDLAALADGGTVAGLTLDEIDRMSVREMRAALRDAKEKDEAKDRLLGDKNSKIDELSTRLAKANRRIKTLSADEAAKELRQEVTAIALEAEVDIAGKLREAFNALSQHSEETGTDHSAFQASLVRQLENLLAAIRNEFQLPDNDGAPLTAADFGWIEPHGTDAVQG